MANEDPMIVDVEWFEQAQLSTSRYHDGVRGGVGKPDSGEAIASYMTKALNEYKLRSSRANVGEESPRLGA
jgi:hypothetical protein